MREDQDQRRAPESGEEPGDAPDAVEPEPTGETGAAEHEADARPDDSQPAEEAQEMPTGESAAEPDADATEPEAGEASDAAPGERAKPAAATPEPEGPKEVIGVLMMAYGGPDLLEDVPAYLLDVRGGRPMPDELVEEFVERYGKIGGRSPILELTEAQAAGVQRSLNDRRARDAGIEYRAYVGMRHWHPYIRDVVPKILEDGVEKLVAVVMAPHYSKMSVGKYMEQLDEALEAHGADIPVYRVESWKDQPMFISGVSSRIRDALRKFPANERKDVPVVYTAHSLPERILEWGDPYPDELRISVEMVADRVRQRHWRFAYQSQGATNEPWLGPDVETTLDELAAEGFKQVLIVPIGFVCDHVEILYDVDVEHAEHAEKLGMHLERIRSLNDGPMLCRAVAESVRRALPRDESAEDDDEADAEVAEELEEVEAGEGD
jgi:protoporphyrin/coproporphyrin ferrochelatase